MLKVFILLVGFAVTGASCLNSTSVTEYTDEPIEVQVGEAQFSTIIRDDAFERAKGLSGTGALQDDEAMLFIFSGPDRQSFWMKDMNFSLDFLWIRDGAVIGIDEGVLHPDANDGKTARVGSPGPVDMVMELNAGRVQALGIKKGDEVVLGQVSK